MTDRITQTANARVQSREDAWRRRYEVQLEIAAVVYEHTGCEKCKQRNWCRNERPDGSIQFSCMSHKELARTLEQHQVLTPRNKTSWSPTQVKDILKKHTPTPPVKDGPLDEFFG